MKPQKLIPTKINESTVISLKQDVLVLVLTLLLQNSKYYTSVMYFKESKLYITLFLCFDWYCMKQNWMIVTRTTRENNGYMFYFI